MFIVWRKRPITTDRPVELFVDYFDYRGKRRRLSEYDLPPWRAETIFCRHKGPARVTWTPLLMHAERVKGRPRQKLLRRFHAIRSCYIADPFTLAAWWYAIDQWAEDAPGWNDEESLYFYRDKKAIFTKLREVVPRPSRKGVELFTAYRLEKEAEEKRHRQEEQECRRRESERQSQERQRQAWGATFGRSPASGPAWWDVLGVPRTAGEAEVKRRYRELAKEHHPDRNPGDKEAKVRFLRVQEAYERARAALGF